MSVGEILGAEGFISAFLERHPDWEIAVSTTTRTGHEVAKKRYPGKLVFYYPVDLSFAIRRVLRRIRPSAVILMELEIWPNFLLASHHRGIPVGLINGRISDRSFKGYQFWKRIFPHPLHRIDCYCVQNDQYATRLLDLGVGEERIHVTGTMKFDNVATGGGATRDGGLARELGLLPDELVLIGGSTHPPEERILYRAFRALRPRHPNLRLLLAPRHPERLPEVEQGLAEDGARIVRRTALRTEEKGSVGPGSETVILIDTIGELGKLYGLADVVFVGGSLIPHGGQNMMEPAGLGKPVVFGPHTFNFEDSVEVLVEKEAVRVVAEESELESVLDELLRSREEREAMGRKARNAIEDNKGSSLRNLDIIDDRIVRIVEGSDPLPDSPVEPGRLPGSSVDSISSRNPGSH